MPFPRPALRRAAALVLATPALALPLVVLPVTSPTGHAAHPVAARLHTLAIDTARVPRLVDGPNASGHHLLAATGEQTVARFGLVGLTWTGPSRQPHLAALVRTRSRGQWSAWQSLNTTSDDRPDPKDAPAARSGTEPLTVAASDGLQVRLESVGGVVTAKHITVQMVDPGTSAADNNQGVAAADNAYAGTSQPTIVTRAQWGADESHMNWDPAYSPTVKVAFVHHTDTTNAYYSKAEAMQQVRGVYAYHSQSLGWGDIGYNYLIDRFGTIYEGRYGGIDSTVIGGHTYGFNGNTTGIALLGTYDSVSPSAATLHSLEKLLAWKLGRFHRDPAGSAVLTAGTNNGKYPEGQQVTFKSIVGHRDGYNTDCPGGLVYSRLDEVRSAASAILGTRLVDPWLIPSTSPNRANISAAVQDTETWKVTMTGVGGEVLHTASGTAYGGRLQDTWDLAVRGQVLPGHYTVTITATASGRSAPEAVRMDLTISASGGVSVLYPSGTWLTDGTTTYRLSGAGRSLVKRPVLSAAALATYPNAANLSISASPSLLATYPTGAVLPYRDGTLLRANSDNSLYVMSAGKRAPIDAVTVATLGYHDTAALGVPATELAKIPLGAKVASQTHPVGTYITDGSSYWVVVADSRGVAMRRPLTSTIALASWAPLSDVVQQTTADATLPIDTYVRGVADGVVLRYPDGPKVYVVSGGLARWVTTAAVFNGMHFTKPDTTFTVADLGHDVTAAPTVGTNIDKSSTTLTLLGTSYGDSWQAQQSNVWLLGTVEAASPARAAAAP